MKNKTYYYGYENLTTGRFTFTRTNSNLKELVKNVSNHDFGDLTTSDLVLQLVDQMESNVGKNDENTQRLLLITMIKTYNDSGLKFGDEDLYWFRTNGEKFHTLGKKLWKGITPSEAEKFFKKNLQKDYDSLYQTW
jgi:hypothetical protein